MTQGLSDRQPDRRKRAKPVIGIAGGIGAGKSQVARFFEAVGAVVIDSDRLAHQELEDPVVIATLRRWWGDSVLHPSGGIDRSRVGSLVFGDAAELSRLEQLLYPRIERRRRARMAELDCDLNVKAIVIDAPKLYEAGVDKECDVVVFVEAERVNRVARVAASRNWSEEELSRRENLQNPLDTKKASADYVITNNSGLEELRIQVEQVLSSVLAAHA